MKTRTIRINEDDYQALRFVAEEHDLRASDMLHLILRRDLPGIRPRARTRNVRKALGGP